MILISSCEKYDTDIEGDIDIYLLDEYDTEEGSAAIINTGIVLSNEPVIYYDEIKSYNSRTYTFKLTADAADRLEDYYQSAFAVTIDGEIIYTAYFWSSFSSLGVDWVVTDLLRVETSNEMKMQLGYPGLIEGTTIPDKRNDNRILSVFKRDGKLVD